MEVAGIEPASTNITSLAILHAYDFILTPTLLNQ